MKSRDVEMKLPVTLTEAEKVRYGRKLAESIGARKKLEEELASVKDQYKGRLSAAQGEIDRLTSIVADGTEVRPVVCSEQKHYDLGEVKVYRTDTWELVDARPMALEERQLGLKFEEKEDGKRREQEALEVSAKLISTLSACDEETALELLHAGLDVVGDNKKTLDLFEAGEKACHSRPRVLAEIDRLRKMLAEVKPAEPPAAEVAPAPEPATPSAPTPLDVDCSRCGVVAGEPCRSLTRGKGQGKPLADGTYHDERIEALAPAEPTSESWGDEIEDDEDGEEVG